MEIENAVNQARKELASRLTFKGSTRRSCWKKAKSNSPPRTSLNPGFARNCHQQTGQAPGQFEERRVGACRCLAAGPLPPGGQNKTRIEQAVAKQITAFIRDSKLKVTTQIQGEAIRVSGKSKDDLQAVIAAVRGNDFPAALASRTSASEPIHRAAVVVLIACQVHGGHCDDLCLA